MSRTNQRTHKILTMVVVFAAFTFSGAITANADTFLTRAMFCATASNCTNNITFEGPTTDTSQPLPTSITFLGVAFSIGSGRTNAGVEVIDGFNVGAPGTNILTAAGNVLGPLGMINNIDITLPAGVTAVGFDIKSGNTSAGSQTGGAYEIYVNGVLATTVVIPTYSAFGFFGVTDLAGIQTISIRSISGGEPVLDNFSFGPNAVAEPVPEPASMLLLGTGLAGTAAALRKRRSFGRAKREEKAVSK